MVEGSMKLAVMAGLGLIMASCGGAEPSRPAPRVTPPTAPPPPVDQCGASELQRLIGRPRTEIPVPVDVTSRRVTCTSCPLTEDYSPTRLNILYNRDIGLVERVFCG